MSVLLRSFRLPSWQGSLPEAIALLCSSSLLHLNLPSCAFLDSCFQLNCWNPLPPAPQAHGQQASSAACPILRRESGINARLGRAMDSITPHRPSQLQLEGRSQAISVLGPLLSLWLTVCPPSSPPPFDIEQAPRLLLLSLCRVFHEEQFWPQIPAQILQYPLLAATGRTAPAPTL